jgi:TetR/AcrR family transcriptional regulator
MNGDSVVAVTPRSKSPVRRPRQEAAAKRRDIAKAAATVFIANGLDGARTTDIAAAAGITETILYRHFRSKQEIFEAAVLTPVELLANDLLSLTSEFRHITAERRLELTRRTHQRFFEVVAEIAPLIGVALFSNHEAGTAFYQQRLMPVFNENVKALAEAMPGRVRAVVEPRTLFITIFGMHLALALDADLRGVEVDPEEIAADVTELIAFGLFAPTVPEAASETTE